MNTNLTTFDTMTSDLRGDRGWGLIKHCIKDTHRLLPHYGSYDTSSNSLAISQYVGGKWIDGTWTIFGWGKDGTDAAWYKYDSSSNSWTTPASNTGNVGSRVTDIAFYFEGNFYGYGAGKLSKWIPATSFTAGWHTTGFLSGSSWQSIAEPVIVGANAYFAMDNIVYELATGGTSLTTKYTLSSDRLVTSLSQTGGNLSVMTYHRGTQTSREFLFNVAGSDTNAYEQLDWGTGKVVYHREIRGIVLAATIYPEPVFTLRRRSGSQMVTDAHVHLESTSSGVFDLVLTDSGATGKVHQSAIVLKTDYTTVLGEDVSGLLHYRVDGTWHVERTNEMDDNNSSAHGFIYFDDLVLIANGESGSNITTTLFANYTPSGGGSPTHYDMELHTRVIDHGDRASKKALVGATVSFEPIPDYSLSTSSPLHPYVKLYYKMPGDASWTLLASSLTEAPYTGTKRLAFSNVRGTVPNYNEIQFKILSRRVSITGFKETSTLVKDEPYDTK